MLMYMISTCTKQVHALLHCATKNSLPYIVLALNLFEMWFSGHRYAVGCCFLFITQIIHLLQGLCMETGAEHGCLWWRLFDERFVKVADRLGSRRDWNPVSAFRHNWSWRNGDRDTLRLKPILSLFVGYESDETNAWHVVQSQHCSK